MKRSELKELIIECLNEDLLNEDFAINAAKSKIIDGISSLIKLLELDGRKADAKKVDKLAKTIKAIK